MRIQQDPKDGLIHNNEVGPNYFDDGDRDVVVSAAVRLVNALRLFGVDIEDIGVSAICDTCIPASLPYRIDLGAMRADQAEAMAAQLEAFAAEFEHMRNEKRAKPKSPPAPHEQPPIRRKRKRKRN
ncbi:hypothetical protein ACFC3O_31640 [Streptomyces sp. NPDC056007]|uniref:hypothetical protein n=1 Tax=Streptomyces sp. NPDC056007 TaxID=3345678 RepID=UPI0035DE711E